MRRWTDIGRGKSITQAISALARSTTDLKNIRNQLEKLTGLQTENMQGEIARGITPVVKACLTQVYDGSGVKVRSGELFSACVSDVRILGTSRGFFIYMSPGKDKHVYATAGSFRFGCIRGSHLSAYQRRKVKPIMATTGGWGGAKYQPPKPGFFQLSAAHTAAIEVAVNEQVRLALQRRGIKVL